MALGMMVVIAKTTKIAAWGLIALLIAIFPANIHMAMNTDLYSQINPIVLYLRLPLQALFIAWAYWFTKA